MLRNILSKAVLAVSGLMLVAAAPASYSQEKDPVRIGLLTSRTGVWAEMGEEVARGIMFAVDQANTSGGVDGRRIEVRDGDDEGNPDAGRRAAEKLAREGYNLIVGPLGSAVSLAIVPNLRRWDAAYFAGISKTDKLTGDTCQARSFRTVQSDSMDIAMINAWAENLEGENFAIIAADYAWGRDSATSFKAAVEGLGKSVAATLYVPLGNKDYAPYISQLLAANVDAIWSAVPARDGIAFLKQAEEFGLIKQTPIIGHAMLSDFIVRATGAAQEGMIGTLGYGPDIDTPVNNAFVEAWQEKYNRLPTETEGLGYNTALVMLEGVRLAGSPKPADVSKALSGATVETVFGPLVMRAEDHQLMMPNFIARIVNDNGVMRPVVEQEYGPEYIPEPSSLCKK